MQQLRGFPLSNVHFLSPTPVSSTIEEADVTPDRLSTVLSSVVFDNHVDGDGDIFVSDGLNSPVWISIDFERRLLGFFTFYEFANALPCKLAPLELLEFVNNLNRNVIVVQFGVSDCRLIGHYWMSFDTRVDPRQIVKMLRLFSNVFASTVGDLQAKLDEYL